ncbi:MAG: prolipoprotein diacylglyceryl transferase [Verrucomicrobiales bacterium]
MHPTLTQYPHISSYPALLLLGFIFGYWLAVVRARKAGIPRNHVDNLVLILLVAGLIGARFFARYFYMKTGFWSAFKVWEGTGLVFYGGFIFGILSVLAYTRLRRLNHAALLDCLAPSVALGLAFGRIGCFMGGCCWGDACLTQTQAQIVHEAGVRQQVQTFPSISSADFPLALTYPQKSDIYDQHRKLNLIDGNATRSLPVHPVQLYEAALAFLLAFGLHFWSKAKNLWPGQVSMALLAGYALIRFCTEYLRADNKPIYSGLTISQVISIVLLGLAAICWTLTLLRQRKLGKGKLPSTRAPDSLQPASS